MKNNCFVLKKKSLFFQEGLLALAHWGMVVLVVQKRHKGPHLKFNHLFCNQGLPSSPSPYPLKETPLNGWISPKTGELKWILCRKKSCSLWHSEPYPTPAAALYWALKGTSDLCRQEGGPADCHQIIADYHRKKKLSIPHCTQGHHLNLSLSKAIY